MQPTVLLSQRRFATTIYLLICIEMSLSRYQPLQISYILYNCLNILSASILLSQTAVSPTIQLLNASGMSYRKFIMDFSINHLFNRENSRNCVHCNKNAVNLISKHTSMCIVRETAHCGNNTFGDTIYLQAQAIYS